MRWRLWPRSLAARVGWILCTGLVLAHVLALGLILMAQGETALAMMRNYLPQDLATAVAILERLPADERAAWLPRLARRGYGYALRPPEPGAPLTSGRLSSVVAAIAAALGPTYHLAATTTGGTGGQRVALHLALHDGTPLTIDLVPPPLAVSPLVAAILVGQLVVIAILTGIAVRLTTRPLSALAAAADRLGPALVGAPLPEHGPREVAQAATAFNAMQRRIADHLAERLQILAAIAHDLQTPLARLALRAEMLEDATLRAPLEKDVHDMQRLVEQGLAYARSAHGTAEPSRRIDLHAFLDSLVCDYADAGARIRLDAPAVGALTTGPDTLRRILTNLVDNALKFGPGDVSVAVEVAAGDRVAITVRDRGPGIPPAEIAAVVRPFYRVDGSRSRDTGGSGLGLAIADQLTRALGGVLSVTNRAPTGLEARVTLPRNSAPHTDIRGRPWSPGSAPT